MKKDTLRFLMTLLETPSPSGFEQPAAQVFRDRVREVADRVEGDIHGNSIAMLNPDAPFKIMLAGHIDEIGLMVTHIDDKGFLSVAQIGGMDPSVLVGQRVRILTEKGEIPGAVGRQAIHLMKSEDKDKAVKTENLWVDIGASDKEEASRMVAVGDPMVLDAPCRLLGKDRLMARGCDDKAGAFVVAEVIRRLAGKKLQVAVIGVATVQEEIGLRGAVTSSHQIAPHVGIAIDVGFATDHPEAEPKRTGAVNLGGGPNLHRGPNINPLLEKELEKTARKLKIKCQVTAEPRATPTDANAMQLAQGGAATTLISIPNRYMHTPVEIVSLNDLEQIIELIVEFLAHHPDKRDYRP